jgi:hypothetical protein
VQKYGESNSLAQELRQQVEELISNGDGLEASPSRTHATGESGLQQFHAGFRKAKPNSSD